MPELDLRAIQEGNVDLSPLLDGGEIDIIRQLAKFPRLMEGAARDREPHRITYYLYDLASLFHQQWTRGYDSPHLRFIQPADAATTKSRLALVAALKRVISAALSVLGVHAPDELR